MPKWEYLTLITAQSTEYQFVTEEPKLSDCFLNYRKIEGEKKSGFFGGTTYPRFTEYLDHLGQQEWELVSIVPHRKYRLKYVFKRPM